MAFAAVAALLTTDVALAQQEGGFGLEEIVVTARKREENLQDTPLSISAFTANELKQRQIQTTTQLADVTPNLTFDSYSPSSGQNSSSQIYIRGIGQLDFTAVTDPGVGLYLDGVYMARSIGGAMDFLDLERIEILRGPQGTLFGRNTIGGAVLLHSVRPNGESSSSLEIEIGSDELAAATLDANVPFSENFFGKFSLTKRQRDGYVERVQLGERQTSGIALDTDGKWLGDDDSLGFRASFVWEANDNLDFFLTADYTDEDENGSPSTSAGLNDQRTFPIAGNAYRGPAPPSFPVNSSCPAVTWPPPSPSTNNDFKCLNDTWERDPYESEGTAEIFSKMEMYGLSLEANWSINDQLSFKSITAYRDFDADSSRDGDGTPYRLFHTQDPFTQTQFSQELQLSGTAFGDKLEWVVGAYYFEEEAENANPVQLPFPYVGAIISGGEVENENYAFFSQATYDFTEQWSLTAGVRYTDETKEFYPYSWADSPVIRGRDGDTYSYIQSGSGSTNDYFYEMCPTYSASNDYCDPDKKAHRRFRAGERLIPEGWYEQEYDDWTPMLSLAYTASDDMMLYASWSEGFKSGGFDQRYNVYYPEPTTYEPEEATTWEAGIKSSWADNTLRLNAALYYTDYQDVQIVVRQSFAPITFNAGEAEIRGFEVESTWIPTASWLVQAAVGYIDAEYTKIKLEQTVQDRTGINEDLSLPQTPEWSANLGIAWTGDFDGWTVTPRVDWNYTDDVYNNAVNTPQLKQDAYYMINAAISLQSDDGSWEFRLAGRNLNDEEVLVAGTSGYSTPSGYTDRAFARGAEASLSAKYNF